MVVNLYVSPITFKFTTTRREEPARVGAYGESAGGRRRAKPARRAAGGGPPGGRPAEDPAGVAAAGALADVPGVDAVVHELAGRVDERGHRAHVEMRHDEAAPLLLGERLQDAHHRVQVLADPAHHLGL